MRIPDKYVQDFKNLRLGVGKIVIPFNEIPPDTLPEQQTTMGNERSQWQLTPTPKGIEVKRIK